MKTIFSILSIIGFIHLNYAQTVEFIEPRNTQEFNDVEFTHYSTTTHHYVLQDVFVMNMPVNRKIQLDSYDSNFKKVGSNLLEQNTLKPDDANIYEGFHVINDKLYLFKSHLIKVDGRHAVNYYPINEQCERGAGTELTHFKADKALNAGNFHVTVSPDGSKILIFGEMPFEKEGNEKCMLWVYDKNFKLLWEKSYEFSYPSVKGPVNDFAVNNLGNVFIAKRVKIKKEMDFQALFTFTNNGNSVNETKLDMKENLIISSSSTSFDKDNNFVQAGFYFSDKKVGINVSTPTGVFYLKANGSSGDILSLTATDIKGRENLTARQLIQLDGGDYILSGEQIYENKEIVNPGTSTPQYNYEHSNRSIFLYRINNATGDLTWNRQIEREVKSMNDNGKTNSFFIWETNQGELAVLFRDHLYKYDTPNAKVVGPGMANVFNVATHFLNIETGETSKTMVCREETMGGKHGEYMIIPQTAMKISGNSVWLISASKERDKNELVSTKLTY